jgi:glutamate/tyrosine decarboxylase-like PLP-dependent enzyme
MFDESTLKPLFLGPKAENAGLFEQLLIECFRDHCFWRRNFHPEDCEWIKDADKYQPEFVNRQSMLKDSLNHLIASLKRCSPSFHHRYLGHMHTDLQIAGILGEFAALFYSQNNVVAEASPVTARLEVQVINQISEMLGLCPNQQTAPWGYICSGGTAANIQALWVARNVRWTPISIFLSYQEMLKSKDSLDQKIAAKLGAMEFSFGGLRLPLASLHTHQLLNVSIPEIVKTRDEINKTVSDCLKEAGLDERSSPQFEKKSWQKTDQVLRSFSPAERGIAETDKRLLELRRKPISCFPWTIHAASTKHYSIEKIADLLGFGRKTVIPIPIDEHFSINVQQLKTTFLASKTQLDAQGEGPIPLGVIAIVGTTEEGAIDDVSAILELREECRSQGLETWVHVDAAYGGYAAAMLRSSQEGQVALSAPTYFYKLSGSDLAQDPYVRHWEESFRRLEAMKDSDSVTVDPHKMGLLPYPAGVIVFKDSRVKNTVSCEAPYLFDGETVDAFPGRYTLEGSRPGHVAAGVYLAHEVLELNQFHHGAAIGRSMLAARELHKKLHEFVSASRKELKVQFLAMPALNILNYIVCHPEVKSLREQNVFTNLILEEFSADADRNRPIPDFEFFLVSTELPLSKYRGVLESFLANAGIHPTASEWESDSLKVFRSVVMHPHLLSVQTRPNGKPQSMIEAFGTHLADVAASEVEHVLSGRVKEIIARFKRPLRIMIVDDNADHLELVRAALLKQFQYQPILARSAAVAAGALKEAQEHGQPIDLLISDLHLEDDQGKKATATAGASLIAEFKKNFQAVPVMALSAFIGITVRERDAIAADCYFDKMDFVMDQGDDDFVKQVIKLLELKL